MGDGFERRGDDGGQKAGDAKLGERGCDGPNRGRIRCEIVTKATIALQVDKARRKELTVGIDGGC